MTHLARPALVAGTPPEVVARLNAEPTRVIRSPDVRARLTSQGAEVYTMSPVEFAAFFGRETRSAGPRSSPPAA